MGTYVVTGSASGIGAATAAKLRAAEHRVIGVDLRDADVLADLSLAAERDRAVAEVLSACDGTLDGLVTAAGVGPPFDPAQIVSINWFGSHAFLAGLHPALVASGDAQVVAISSNSTTTMPNLTADLTDACLDLDEDLARTIAAQHEDGNAYACSKTAVARFVRRNAPQADWAGAGVRLNAIAPGATMTPLLQSGLDDETYGPLIKGFPVPTGSFGTPEQIAGWIEFMVLSDAARFMAGALVFVDGGTDALVRPDDWPQTFSF